MRYEILSPLSSLMFFGEQYTYLLKTGLLPGIFGISLSRVIKVGRVTVLGPESKSLS